MAIGHRFELLDGQNYGVGGPDVLNAYFYEQTAGTGNGAADLVDYFVSFVLPAILPIQSSKLVHGAIAARNLDVPTDYDSQVLTADNVGLVTGNCLPSFVAWYFRYGRTRTDMNHGGKRICGVPESAQVDGVAEAAVVPTLTTLAQTFSANLGTGQTNQFKPVIMRRLLGPTGALIGYQAFDTTGVSYVRISSQNTRKT